MRAWTALPQRAAIVAVPSIVELNISHAIIAESLFIGLDAAVRKMRHCWFR
jgi:pyridoxine 5'-phosphate synthase PdxJ